jgi:uncharacterized membrane protein
LIVLLAAYDDTAYEIVGLGTVFLNGLYGAQANARRGPEGFAIAQANLKVTNVAQWFIYAIPIFGIALVFMSDDIIEFDQTWIWLSLVLYVVALGISHGLLFPAVKRMHVLMAEMINGPPPAAGPPLQAAEMERLGKRVAAAGLVLNLLVVVLIVLMVVKPGGGGLN